MKTRVPFLACSRERDALHSVFTQSSGWQQKSNPRSSSPPTLPLGSVVAATPGEYQVPRYHHSVNHAATATAAFSALPMMLWFFSRPVSLYSISISLAEYRSLLFCEPITRDSSEKISVALTEPVWRDVFDIRQRDHQKRHRHFG